jgi:hypothetical protein
VTLPAIPEGARRPESELWPAFEAARPRVLGALLAAVATGLARLPETRLARLPRMADFALWVAAAEPALWPEPGAFLRTYAGNRADAREVALEASPLVPALRALVAEALFGRWEGTATDLLRRLNDQADERTQKAEGWPKNGQALGGALRRLAPDLRATGLDVEVGKKGPRTDGRKRLVVLRALPPPGTAAAVGPVGEPPDEPAPASVDVRTGVRTGAQKIVPIVPPVPPPAAPGGEDAPRGDDGGTISARGDDLAADIVPPAPEKGDDGDGGDDLFPSRGRTRITAGGRWRPSGPPGQRGKRRGPAGSGASSSGGPDSRAG